MKSCNVSFLTAVVLLLVSSALAEMVPVASTPAESRFWSWLNDNGADVSSIAWPAMDPATGSRGVMATRDIPRNRYGTQVYLRVPERLMITEAKALSDPKFGQAITQYQSADGGDKWVTEFDRLALYLIFMSSDKEHFFHPYTEIMPEPSMLADWEQEEEVPEVQDTQLVNQMKTLRANMKRRFEALSKIRDKFPEEIFTWERFHWAMGNMNQRAFSIRDEEDEILYNAMVPGADLLNHVNIGTHYKMISQEKKKLETSNNKNEEETTSGFEETYILYPVDTTITKGQECFNGYGILTNGHLLQNYGFGLEGNRFDVVAIQLDSTITVNLRDLSSGQNPVQAIAEFPGTTFADKLKRCEFVCGAALPAYPTTLEQDFDILNGILAKGKNTTERELRLRFALNHRIGQKLILRTFADYCAMALKESALDEKSAFELIRNLEEERRLTKRKDKKPAYNSKTVTATEWFTGGTDEIRAMFKQGVEEVADEL